MQFAERIEGVRNGSVSGKIFIIRKEFWAQRRECPKQKHDNDSRKEHHRQTGSAG
jgi:hypothetical protein